MKCSFFFFAIVCSVAITQQSYAATLEVRNKATKDIKVTVYWGSGGSESEERYLVMRNSTKFSPTLRAFTKIHWQEGDGYYNLDIPSTRGMQGGFIEIKDNGRYVINFNKDGVYDNDQVELSNVETSTRLYKPTNKYSPDLYK